MLHVNLNLWEYEQNILIHYDQLQEHNLEQFYQDSYIEEIMYEVNFEIPFGEIGLPMESYLYLRA